MVSDESTVRPRKLVESHVRAAVERLQAGYLPRDGRAQPTAAAISEMATLRRADPVRLGEDPQAWGLVWTGMDERLLGSGDTPSAAERAVHAGLVLYAVHQQSRTRPMFVPGPSLGAATRDLARALSRDGSLDQATLRRLDAVVLARAEPPRLYHLRALVKLLRSHEVPLDHARLAGDLYELATRPGSTAVRTRWGRDLHRSPRPSTPASEAPSQPENGAA